MYKIILALALAGVSSRADQLYNNTATDQQFSVFYSTGFTQIGDQIQMVSSGTLASLAAQFYNAGSDATFDALLQFYQVGSPVGSQIGGTFAATGVFIAGGNSQTVTFPDLGNLPVPQDVIVVLSIQNETAGGDVGVNFFDPPTVGASDDSFFIANDGTGFTQASTNLGIDNIYSEINGTATPEPSTAALALGGLVLIAGACRRRRNVIKNPA
jgi:MYXO-CTERM domain-containing protein